MIQLMRWKVTFHNSTKDKPLAVQYFFTFDGSMMFTQKFLRHMEREYIHTEYHDPVLRISIRKYKAGHWGYFWTEVIDLNNSVWEAKRLV